MKKTILLIAALISYSSAFADYGYSYDNGLSGFGVFCLIVMIAYIILSIIILVRWWRMTENVDQIRQHLIHKHKNTKLTYLVAIGEKEQAQKSRRYDTRRHPLSYLFRPIQRHQSRNDEQSYRRPYS